jgi:hypothetical protein
MADVFGQAAALTVLTPVRRGEEERLLEVLDRLSRAAPSPFGRIDRTHFARLVLVDRVHYTGPPQHPDPLSSAYLLFSCSFDGAVDSYLEEIRTAMPAEADAVWNNCVDYPGSANAVGFSAYLLHNRVRSTAFISGYGDATVPQTRYALALRDRLSRFAAETGQLGAAALRAAFQQEFPP